MFQEGCGTAFASAVFTDTSSVSSYAKKLRAQVSTVPDARYGVLHLTWEERSAQSFSFRPMCIRYRRNILFQLQLFKQPADLLFCQKFRLRLISRPAETAVAKTFVEQ